MTFLEFFNTLYGQSVAIISLIPISILFFWIGWKIAELMDRK